MALLMHGHPFLLPGLPHHGMSAANHTS
jgi:hypothetical protein